AGTIVAYIINDSIHKKLANLQSLIVVSDKKIGYGYVEIRPICISLPNKRSDPIAFPYRMRFLYDQHFLKNEGICPAYVLKNDNLPILMRHITEDECIKIYDMVRSKKAFFVPCVLKDPIIRLNTLRQKIQKDKYENELQELILQRIQHNIEHLKIKENIPLLA